VGEGLERVLGLVEVLQQQLVRRDLSTLHRVLCRVESELLSLGGAANNGEIILTVSATNIVRQHS